MKILSIQRTRFLFRILTRRKLDVLDLLERDHLRVEVLYLRWKLSRDSGQQEKIFSQIKKELLAHSHFEETVFYPACEKINNLRPFIAASYEEHKQFKIDLREMSHLSMIGEKAHFKMNDLMQKVNQHVQEEESDLFPQVRSLMKANDLYKLAREFRNLRRGQVSRVAA